MGYSGAWGNWFMNKTWSRKFRGTVPLSQEKNVLIATKIGHNTAGNSRKLSFMHYVAKTEPSD